MKKILGLALMLLRLMIYAEDTVVMKNGIKAWRDQNYIISAWHGLEQLQHFSGQEYEFEPDPRQVTMYVKEPNNGINANTVLMLMLHNWGGSYTMAVPWCDALSDRYNVIAVSVDYLQSGQTKHDKVPYDHGLLQAMDCLRALYQIQEQLKAKGVAFNPRRVYSVGGSGGGNVSLMVNKLAPSTFSCIVDMCGMPGLTDDIAFGSGRLNAGYSKDPKSPKYLTPARQEICNPGYLPHLERQQKLNPDNKVIIVHGQDDEYCSVIDKITIFQNMIKAKFRPEGYFITKADLDGVALTSSGHPLGDRQAIIIKYADSYLTENGTLAASVKNPTDFETARKVEFTVTGGNYIVDFSSGAPTLLWHKK